MEVPGEFDNDVSIIYTYSVEFKVGVLTTVMISYM